MASSDRLEARQDSAFAVSTVAGSLEQIGNDRLLRREAKAARVGKAQDRRPRGDQNEQKQHDEDFEARVAMATTDLGLLTILTVLLTISWTRTA